MLLRLSCESVTGSWPSCLYHVHNCHARPPTHPPTRTCTWTVLLYPPASTSPLFHSSPHGPSVTRWEVPFCPNFLQPLCNHLNLLPNLPILRAVQNFPRHDNSPSSSHLVLFRSILLTPTAIALSSLHEGPFSHSAPLAPTQLVRAACPFLVRLLLPS